MSNTNIRNLSIICNKGNKNADNSYKINLGKLSYNSVKVASLKSVTFRNLQYNVIGSGPRKNNIFHFLLNGAPEVVVVPEGYYSISELLAVVKTGIELIFASSGIVPLPFLTSITYDPITAKVSIVVDGQGVAIPVELQGKTFPESINLLLGNTEDITLDTLGATIYTFDSIINLEADDRVHLVSSAISQNSGLTSTGSNNNNKNGRSLSLVRALAVNSGFGGLCLFDSFDIDAEAIIYTLPQNYTELDISLQDIYGNILDLQNSTLTIELLTWQNIPK
ncbi:MAG: hypothetical protein ACW986_19950 [Promethearchaeota archaeon]|jgi:hypothetical protein